MSRGSERDIEIAQSNILGILPYIANGHLRMADNLGLLNEGVATLQAPNLNTVFHLSKMANYKEWAAWGWEDAALSNNGEFPEALQEYSDGFEVTVRGMGCAVIGASNEEELVFRPMRFDQLVAFKDIIWGASLANLEHIHQYQPDGVLESEPVPSAFDDVYAKFKKLCVQARELYWLDRSLQLSEGQLLDDDASGSALKLEQWCAAGNFENIRIQATLFTNPEEARNFLEDDDRVIFMRINFGKPLKFMDTDGDVTKVKSTDMIIDAKNESVIVAPLDDDEAYTFALCEESLEKLSRALDCLVPDFLEEF